MVSGWGRFAENLEKIFVCTKNSLGENIECSFKFRCRKVDCDRTTDHLFKFNLTFCAVLVLTSDEWCVHNRLFNANFDDKLIEHPIQIGILKFYFFFLISLKLCEINANRSNRHGTLILD
jgi:hypothetical protein